MSKEERKYCVYCHTNKVNGKKYVGITSQRPKARWGKNGKGYTHCSYFYNAIQKYGWNNFEHSILFEKLTKEEAENKEIKLIAEWNLTNEKFGYNLAKGGLALNRKARAKLSKALKGRRLGAQPPNYKPFIGKKFGRLTVISEYTKNWRHYCVCKCDCGNEVTVMADNLRNQKHTKSCGCLKREILSRGSFIHGMTETKIYNIWRRMKRYCYNQNTKGYLMNIEVCDEWKNDFISFYSWGMSSGYKDGLSIQRKDASKNYEPSNCYWGKNICNRGRHILCIETGIEYPSIKEASRIMNIPYVSIQKHLAGVGKTAGSRGSNSNNGKGFHFVYITDEPPKDEKK